MEKRRRERLGERGRWRETECAGVETTGGWVEDDRGSEDDWDLGSLVDLACLDLFARRLDSIEWSAPVSQCVQSNVKYDRKRKRTIDLCSFLLFQTF